MGKVKGKWINFSVNLIGRPQIPENIIPGVGNLLGNTGSGYGYSADDMIKVDDPGMTKQENGIRTVFKFESNAFDALMDAAINRFYNTVKAPA